MSVIDNNDRSKAIRILVLIWMLPLLGLALYFIVENLIKGFQMTRLVGWMAIGLSWLVLCVFLLLYWILCNSRIFRGIFLVILVGLLLLIAIAAIVTAFQGFRILLGIAALSVVIGLIKFRQDFWFLIHPFDKKRFLTWIRTYYSLPKIRKRLIIVGIFLLFTVPGILSMTSPLWDLQTRSFTVTTEQAQHTDLVFYFASSIPSDYANNLALVDLAKEFNVTLTLAWIPSECNDTTNGTLGFEMAQFVHYANEEHVNIEIFPCFSFNWEEILNGSYSSDINQTLTLYQYWTLFKSWLSLNNCSVNYVLWDIEEGSSPSDIAGLIPWLPTTLVIGLAQRTRELPAIRAVFSQILSETLAMGAKTRITTYSPLENNEQLYNGLIGYLFPDLVANGSIQYISCMQYANRWGDVNPDQLIGLERVYDTADQEREVNPNLVGIDIGNINGNGETTIAEVINQYYLAIAGGATSVRLFNGASWVDGWNYTVVGPTWGINGTRALFEACRQGGIGTFTENQDWNTMEFGNVEAEIGLNLLKF